MHTILKGSRKLLCLFVLLFPAALFAQAGPAQNAPGLDRHFAELSTRLPGFGGYFFDANGDLNVYLTDLSKAGAARAALAETARGRAERAQQPWARPAEIVVRRGNFDVQQLDQWRGRLVAELRGAGAHVIDLDEAANRLYVGVTDEQAKSRLQAAAQKAGIPASALTVEVVPEAQFVTTLQQSYRPLVGGLQIDFNVGGVASYCTLGVNVWYSNLAVGVPVGTPGFFTASHCSNTYGGTDGTVYSQGGSRIGYEMYDPPFFTNAQNTRCVVGNNCRWSDVNFVAYDAGVNRLQGYLAQTVYAGYGVWNPGSLDITGHRQINGGSWPVVGNYIDKVGRTTGWTSGQVSRTCFDVYIGSTGMLCQDQVEAYADGGDSGSPVFQWNGQNTGAFAGIVWAKTGSGAFIFSNQDRISNDMGYGTTYTP
jgi:hypothetical protein